MVKKTAKKRAVKPTKTPRSSRPTRATRNNAPKNSTRADVAAKLATLRLTHPDRVVYPEQAVTKRELAEYYLQIADWILPQIAGRPLSLVRCPEGAGGQCFFQKHPPVGLSSTVERIKIQEGTGLNDYLVVNDIEGVIALVQFGALELHVWGSRADDVEHPDRLVMDLDPDPAVPWSRVIEGAFLVCDALKALNLASFVKTTGGKGIHVVVPIARQNSWDEVKEFTHAIADLVVSAAPDRYLANMSKAARRGKIFVDYLRNQRGATAVSAYSTRASSAASVSMPLDWNDLKKSKSATEFNVRNAPARLAGQRRDPWQEIGKIRQSITAAAWKMLRRTRAAS